MTWSPNQESMWNEELNSLFIIANEKSEWIKYAEINFPYELGPIVHGREINVKSDFIMYCNNKVWYRSIWGFRRNKIYTDMADTEKEDIQGSWVMGKYSYDGWNKQNSSHENWKHY